MEKAINESRDHWFSISITMAVHKQNQSRGFLVKRRNRPITKEFSALHDVKIPSFAVPLGTGLQKKSGQIKD